MKKKEFLKEVAKRFKYVTKPLKGTGQDFGGLQGYSMWIAQMDGGKVKEISVHFWVRYGDGGIEDVIIVQAGIEYVGGEPVIIEQIREILDKKMVGEKNKRKGQIDKMINECEKQFKKK